MAIISVTRLRLRSRWLFPAFVLHAVRSSRQAKKSPGHLGMKLSNEAMKIFWTCTAWADEASLKAFVIGQPHLEAMKKLPGWCDEGAMVHWIQDDATLPDWKEAHRRLQSGGRPSKVDHPSADHLAFRIPPPRRA